VVESWDWICKPCQLEHFKISTVANIMQHMRKLAGEGHLDPVVEDAIRFALNRACEEFQTKFPNAIMEARKKSAQALQGEPKSAASSLSSCSDESVSSCEEGNDGQESQEDGVEASDKLEQDPILVFAGFLKEFKSSH